VHPQTPPQRQGQETPQGSQDRGVEMSQVQIGEPTTTRLTFSEIMFHKCKKEIATNVVNIEH
jgi:hypothetical protein